MPLEIKLHAVPHLKGSNRIKDISVGKGMVELLYSKILLKSTHITTSLLVQYFPI